MTRTLPVRSILSLLLLSAIGCAGATGSPQESEALAMQLDGSRVVVVPLNLGIKRSPTLDQKSGAVGRELIAYLETHGAEVNVLSHEDASPLWARAFAGQGDLHATSAQFARLVAREGDFDMLIMPSVVIRGARVQGDAVSWDGVRRMLDADQTVADPKQDAGYEQVSVRGLDGKVAAASFHLVALDDDGQMIFEGLAGLDVMQEAELQGSADSGDWKLKAKQEPLRDLDHVREGVEMAFERRLPTTARSW
jgi:hypothetical protein